MAFPIVDKLHAFLVTNGTCLTFLQLGGGSRLPVRDNSYKGTCIQMYLQMGTILFAIIVWAVFSQLLLSLHS
jgi:hypothetical protein